MAATVRTSRAKHLLFAGMLALLVVAAVEMTSFVVYRFAFGAWFDHGEDRVRRQLLLAGEPAPDPEPEARAEPPRIVVPGTMEAERLHPFLGFVHDFPSDPKRFLVATPWGFYRRGKDPPAPEHAYRIGIVGGSAAYLFSFKGGARLIEGLRDASFVDGRPIEVASLALGGYKQPQQLMTVAWLLAEGERFDMVVNLDGFNEVAFGAENAQRGVYPSYPRNWSVRIGERDAFADLAVLGRAAAAAASRRELAAFFEGPVWRRTVTGNLVWRLLDRAAAARIQRAEADVGAGLRTDLGYQATGPPFAARDDAALYRAIASHWRQSSLQLHRLCRANGIRYVHLLQPNQYLAGSKPMGAEERAIAIVADHPRREAVEKGYPVLRAEGEMLRAVGVDFHDLTQLYATVREVVYDDACCHVNQLGNELIADYLVSVVNP